MMTQLSLNDFPCIYTQATRRKQCAVSLIYQRYEFVNVDSWLQVAIPKLNFTKTPLQIVQVCTMAHVK